MRVLLYGATGRAGSRILHELLARGHEVVAVARDASKIPPRPGLKTVNDDLTSVERTAEIVKDADAVISAYAPPPENTDQLIPVTKLLADATAQGGAKRLLMVGGAGGLEVAPGVTLLGSGHLPKEWVPIASSHVRAFELLRSSAIDWTYVAPAAFFEPGIRTGSYRLGTDNLVVNDQGNSRVSMEDYAIAMVDELENPRHRRQRFSVGY